MDPHPIPRQITTFEFKLVGFMTLRQFGYVLLGGVVGYLVFLLVQVQIVNIVVGVLVGSVGLVFAFVPINDRPFEVFIRNLLNRLRAPTQYLYHKRNPPLDVFGELYFDANPHVAVAHAESLQKLEAYMQSKKKVHIPIDDKEHHAKINKLFQAPSPIPPQRAPESPPDKKSAQVSPGVPKTTPDTPQPQDVVLKHPVLSGTVVNRRHIPLPGILVYIKDPPTGKTLRILKTNPHGVFATFHPIPHGDYTIEVVDPAGNYSFDNTTLSITGDEKHGVEEYMSKETI